ncbi:MAG: aminotransferase class I/II-fold pyridoxal phosphate-dependent enzyme, partial [Planctomycetota bacterium]
MRETDASVAEQSRKYQHRRDVLVSGLRRLGWEVEPPRAGMFVWAAVPEPYRSQMSTMDFAMKLMRQADVAVSPGSGFGPAGEGYLRLALVENEQRLRQAVRQIGRALRDDNKPDDAAANR